MVGGNRAREKKSGVFKLFLGYAPGVGKTYAMLSEAIRRQSRGEDVVIGVVETHGRKATQEIASRLETVPRKKIDYKGTLFEEMDVDAILARHPQVVLVDELAHTNIEGSKHHKRYEDVFELLDNKIDVVSTMNVQHLESVTPMVHKITGVLVRETVPDWVLKRVDEIVMSDVTPEALQTRMRRGDIYPMERVDRALGNFFRPSNLIALREVALRHVAQVVDRSLEPYLETEGAPGRDLNVAERIARRRQLQSRRAVSGGAGFPHGAGHQWRAIRLVRRYWGRWRRSGEAAVAAGESSIRRKPWGKDCAAQGQGRRPGHGGVRPRKAHHADDFRTLGHQRLAQVPVHVGRASLPARCPGGGRSHREAAAQLNAHPTRTSWWWTTSRKSRACCVLA